MSTFLVSTSLVSTSLVWQLGHHLAMPCPCHAVPCHAMPCRAMPCRAVPCRAMPCHAMPCHAVPCHAMPCRAVQVGHHLVALGSAYHSQGKLEAAALTLEEARSILIFALGPNHADVAVVKEQIKKLSVIEVDFTEGGSMATPRPGANKSARHPSRTMPCVASIHLLAVTGQVHGANGAAAGGQAAQGGRSIA